MLKDKEYQQANAKITLLVRSPLLLVMRAHPVPVAERACARGVKGRVTTCYAVWRDDASLSSTAPSRNANSLTS
jgi:hypothetical protein